MNEHRCIDCGTALVAATGLGLLPTEVVDGRPHTDGGCVEYIKAALRASKRHAKGMADLATHLQAELDRMRSRSDAFEAALGRIVEIGEDDTSSDRDLLRAFKIADEALNPTLEAADKQCAAKEET